MFVNIGRSAWGLDIGELNPVKLKKLGEFMVRPTENSAEHHRLAMVTFLVLFRI
jgi:hypothetical protein